MNLISCHNIGKKGCDFIEDKFGYSLCSIIDATFSSSRLTKSGSNNGNKNQASVLAPAVPIKSIIQSSQPIDTIAVLKNIHLTVKKNIISNPEVASIEFSIINHKLYDFIEFNVLNRGFIIIVYDPVFNNYTRNKSLLSDILRHL